jgi:hypothetical protein
MGGNSRAAKLSSENRTPIALQAARARREKNQSKFRESSYMLGLHYCITCITISLAPINRSRHASNGSRNLRSRLESGRSHCVAGRSLISFSLAPRLRMRAIAAILIFFAGIGCTTTRESAVTIAARALADRKLPLPARHSISVSEGYCAVQVGPSYKLWIVEFRARNRNDPLYSIWIDQRFGTTHQFKNFQISNCATTQSLQP